MQRCEPSAGAMASFPDGPVLEIFHGHKREQSQDSGAYIDWNSEDSTSPTGNLDGITRGEFVTVVAVESNGREEGEEKEEGADEEEEASPFVTVLEIGDGDGKAKSENGDVEEEVLVYRLPGERLGFGLKFEGGTNTAENVKRLFIQSSAPDSPASRAECSWGALVEGDEIIRIDGHEVREMTRLDCVRCLKESSVVIKLYIRHPGRTERVSQSPMVISAEMKKKLPPPPPIPPRKVPRKREEVVTPPDGFADGQRHPVPKTRSLQSGTEDSPSVKSQSKSSVFVPAKESRQEFAEGRRISARGVADPRYAPPEPEVYLDILAQEDAKNNCESESDDTGSTISTVMGFSLSATTNSSFDLRSNSGSCCDSTTTPSTPSSTPSTPVLDVAKVPIPHQSVETNDFLYGKITHDSYEEKSSVCGDDTAPLQPPLSFQDAPLSYGNEEIKVSLPEAPREETKIQPEETLDEGDFSPKGSPPKASGKKTSLIPRLAKSIGLIGSPPKPSPRKETGAEKRSSKKRPPPPPPQPPPPPPPRTDRPQPEPESKTLIPYLKKKKGKSESPKKAKQREKSSTEKAAEEATEKEVEREDPVLSWPVPELKSLRQHSESESDGNALSNGSDTDGKAETANGSDAFGSDFAMDAGRDPYFMFQWGSSKHLETIGEDEEDGCTEETPNGQVEGSSNDPKPEIPKEEAADLESEEKKAEEGGEIPAENQDGSVIEEAGRKNREERSDSNGLSAIDDVTPDPKPSDGGMKETMVPIMSAAVGLAPPPTFSRLPPDGHEFPQNYREEGLGLPAAKLRDESTLLFDEELKSELPPLPTTEPPSPQKYSFRLDGTVDILPTKRTISSEIESSLARPSRPSFWRQDEKSEKSVRDKIAMFSTVTDSPVGSTTNSFCPGKLSKYKSSDDVFYDVDDEGDAADCVGNLPNGKHFSRSIVSIDKIGGVSNQVRNCSKKFGYSELPTRSLDYTNRAQSSMDLTSSSSSAYSSSCSPDSSLSSTASSSCLGYSSTLPRKSAAKTSETGQRPTGIARTTSFSLHGRSQSLLDVTPGKSRFRPDGGIDDEQRQSSLNLLVEQRRKNLSKLRGLVIPEKPVDSPPSRPILDLPEIKSRDLILTSKLPNAFREESRASPSKWESSISSTPNLSSPPWKTPGKSPSVPKYSPAFKRKAISVYGSCSAPLVDSDRSKPPAKPPRSLPLQDRSPPMETKHSPERYELTRPTEICSRKSPGRYRNSDTGRSEEDSDNDSAVSSSRSSISHGFSPPSSPLLDGQHQEELPRQLYASQLLEKSPLVRTHSSETTASGGSNTSTLTSGSQASCSSNGGSSSDCNSKRVLKPQSVEAINRKNVLASAKYSRGFDLKSGSPLIQRKFVSSPEKEDGTGEEKHSSEAINYKLATEIGRRKSMDVKIAFINEVNEVCDGAEKRKLTKAESSPCPPTTTIPARGRRTSAPHADSPWSGEDGWTAKMSESFDSGHLPLTGKPSSESLRSRASSVDTIIENVLVNENGLESGSARAAKPSVRRSVEPEVKRSASLETTGDLAIDKVAELYSKSRAERDRLSALKDASARNQRSVSVNDIRKAFERTDLASNGRAKMQLQFGINGNHVRVSSLDSTNSEDSCAFGPGQYGSSSNLHREQFGSITSLASSTSLISPQELQLLIDEANQTLEESGGCSGGSSAVSHDVLVVILHRDTAGGSVGITLAGGADYESKEITVHKVLTGSPADRDGRIQKGDRILSINGKSMKGITHRESLAILKSPRPEVVLVVSRLKSDGSCDVAGNEESGSTTAAVRTISSRPQRILEGSALNDSGELRKDEMARGPPVKLVLVKDGAGLGFSLEGGKDSPLGDKPLVIKKIFTGGAAEKCGHLKAGDEIINVNGIDVTQMSRIEAWKLMKRIPDGNVSITVRRRVENGASSLESDR